jgi:undecaprenyl-diphosphatase
MSSAPDPDAQIGRRLRGARDWIRPHWTAITLLFFGIGIPLLTFGMLADDVLENERFAFDLPIQMFVHERATPAIDHVMIMLSRAGSAWVTAPWDVLLAVLLFARGRHRPAVFWSLSVGGAAALNVLAKHVFSRARPALWISPAPETTFSFPSGHAMQTAAIAAALCVLLWRTRWRLPTVALGGFFVLVVGLSRVYLGVHFPSDVFAAWVASIAWVLGLRMVSRD